MPNLAPFADYALRDAAIPELPGHYRGKVRENYDLTLEPNLTVKVVDVFATALNFLGIAAPADVDGKPVSAIYGKSGSTEPVRRKKSSLPLRSPALDLACNQ